MKKLLVISLVALFSFAVVSPVLASDNEAVKTEQTSKEGEKKACCAKKAECTKKKAECTKKKECTKKAECPKKKACCKK
jgi:hypothetical protein